jgi:crotonobetainyl-CoA:carnitine CoA-transferase CaiB-like acyl-CoA transferase
MVTFLWPEAMAAHAIVGATPPTTPPRPDLIFQTSDGYITVGSLSDSEWRGLCGVLDKPEWIEDARFRTPAARSANAAERLTLVGELLKSRPSDDWLVRLDAAEVPCAPVLRRVDVMNDPQVIHNKLIETIDQPTLGNIRQSRPAARFDRTPARIAGPAPRVGEHSAEVLRELGYSIEDIAALMESRAAKAAS